MKEKTIKYNILIFIIEAICMTLELVASRVLSPYFGNSNIVWTSVIGIILLSSSIGNYIGGKIADKKENKKNLKIIIMLASIFVLAIPIIQENFLKLISSLINDIKIGAIISTIILFFIPSALLGTINPIILKIKLNNLENTGKIAGKIYAISTIGGIFGTFLSGFVLIPNFGSIQILFVLSIILLLLSIVSYSKMDKLTVVYTIFMLIANLGLFAFYSNNNTLYGEQVLNGDENVKTSFDTQYGRVLVYNTYMNKEPIRMLNIDSGFESATYTEEGKQNELVFRYTKYYDLMFQSKNNIEDVLLIGGAGYSYPKYYISHYENKKMDVVEIDEDITKIARKYFYLDKLIQDYNIEENHRLNLINEDGRTYLNNNTKKYDAILNDAFSGENPAKTLTTLETINKIKESLNQDGLYLTNVISSLEGEKSKFVKAEVNTLKQVFKNVYVIPCRENVSKEVKQNIMVISTDQDIEFENVYNLELKDDEITLTDNYCPIDNF
ncbi:MAG: fused MFS/spermidine synthase [Clostridia bacterium]|nr:fused MFS/spermidine synthase [Clostridia bacterium]